MEKASLPLEKPNEPKEEAHQPMSSSPVVKKKIITFADSETYGSQTSSNYKEALSQPPHDMTHLQKMLWLQKRRTVGLWAQCDDCDKWRYLPDVLDRQELPTKWFCRFNPDKSLAECSIPEVPLRLKEEEDLIHNEYTAGSLVWARLLGWPWWPAMIDDDPDTERYYWLDGFSDIPTYYHVVFLDTEVTRAWISPKNLRPYIANKNKFSHLLKMRKYKTRLTTAVREADDAAKMAQPLRLEKYSFIAKYKGPIRTPKKIEKKVLKKYQAKLQKQYNIETPMDLTDSDETNEEDVERADIKRQNVIMVGTIKSKRQKKREHSPVAEERAPKKITSRRQTEIAIPKSSKSVDHGNKTMVISKSNVESNEPIQEVAPELKKAKKLTSRRQTEIAIPKSSKSVDYGKSSMVISKANVESNEPIQEVAPKHKVPHKLTSRRPTVIAIPKSSKSVDHGKNSMVISKANVESNEPIQEVAPKHKVPHKLTSRRPTVIAIPKSSKSVDHGKNSMVILKANVESNEPIQEVAPKHKMPHKLTSRRPTVIAIPKSSKSVDYGNNSMVISKANVESNEPIQEVAPKHKKAKKLTSRRQTEIAIPKSSKSVDYGKNSMVISKANMESNEPIQEKAPNYKPKTLCKIVEASIDKLGESVYEPASADISQATSSELNIPFFKEPNSMAPQPGSLDDSLLVRNTPNFTMDSQDTNNEVIPDTQSCSLLDTNDDPEFDIRQAPSPSSDDFEF